MFRLWSEVWQTLQQMVDILGITMPTRTKKPWLVLNQGFFYSWSLDEFIPRILLHTQKVGVSLPHALCVLLTKCALHSLTQIIVKDVKTTPIQRHWMNTTCSTRSMTCTHTCNNSKLVTKNFTKIISCVPLSLI